MTKSRAILEQLAKPGCYLYCRVNENQQGKETYFLLEIQGSLPDESGRLTEDGQIICTSTQFREARRTPVSTSVAHRVKADPSIVQNGFVADLDDEEPADFFWFRRV